MNKPMCCNKQIQFLQNQTYTITELESILRVEEIKTTGMLKANVTTDVEVKTDKTSSETWGIKKNGDKAVKIKGKLYSIKDNLEYLKTINDPTIKSHVDEAIKFGFNVNEIAPHGPQKYLDQKGIRGVKKINPAWKKLQDLEKSLTSVKPKKINKRKVR